MRKPPVTEFYARLRVDVGPNCPSLIRRAARQRGMRYNTDWLRDVVARALAAELDDVTYEQVMERMPPSWEQNPGCVKLGQAEKSAV